MPVETRYKRSDTVTVDSETFYQLGVEQSTEYSYVDLGNHTYVGIRVFIRHADGSETEITPGSPVAVANYDYDGLHSATWNCPGAGLSPTDRILVRLYSGSSSANITTLRREWITEQLNASSLDASTWTVYYYLERHVAVIDFVVVSYRFYHGTSTYNSRIEGFSYTPAVVAVKKHAGDGLVWYD